MCSFKAPQKATPWNGVLDAFEYKSQCAQINLVTKLYEGSEDCLYVNVFVPGKNNYTGLDNFSLKENNAVILIISGCFQG